MGRGSRAFFREPSDPEPRTEGFAMSGLLTAKELREKRANLFQQADEILNRAREEKRELTDEERQTFDQIHNEIERLGEEARRIERHEDLQRELEQSRGVVAGRQDMRGDVIPQPASLDAEQRERIEAEAFRTWLRGGMSALTPEQRSVMERRYADLPSEARALSAATGGAGGYTVPQGFERRLEEAMLAYGGMLEAAELIPTQDGASFPWPTANDVTNIGARVAENTQVADNADPAFGQVMFGAHMYTSKIVRVPIQLIQDNAVDLESRLVEWLATRIARAVNAETTSNDPNNPANNGGPRGILIGAQLGHTTGSATALGYEERVALEPSVDPAARRAPGTQYMFHDQTHKVLKQLNGNAGRPLGLPGVAVREPDTVLGSRYTVNQDMPTPAASAKAILFGDLRKYKIRIVRGVAMLRLAERYADYLQVGFMAFQRFDGSLVDAGTNPVKYLQLAANGD